MITGDESWRFEYDPDTQHHSDKWHTSNCPCPKKARKGKLEIKLMFIYFSDHQGVVHKDFVSQGQTVNHTFYWEVLEWFKDIIVRQQHSEGTETPHRRGLPAMPSRLEGLLPAVHWFLR